MDFPKLGKDSLQMRSSVDSKPLLQIDLQEIGTEEEDEDIMETYLRNAGGSGLPETEMVDDVQISPRNYKRVVSPEEDDFDCDAEAVVIGGGGGFGPTTHTISNA